MRKHGLRPGWAVLIAFAVSCLTVVAQEATNETKQSTQVIEADSSLDTSEFVTINVKDANIAEVLKAYSLQTGQSIVVGPDVVSENVNVRLNNIPWEEALDVILKPYGFGYRVVGDTIVISKLENIVTVEGIEPLVSRVFRLRFLDAYDIKLITEAQLSARGKFTILETKSLPGWEFGGEGSSGAATEGGIRTRKKKEQIQKSKTFVVTDVPSAITKIESIIEEMDALPEQVLIEAKFLEISRGDLSDIGLDYAMAMETVEGQALAQAGSTPVDAAENLLNPISALTDSLQAGAMGKYSSDNGIRLSHSILGDWGADMLIAFMQKDDDANILSSPSILTLNNQEASILVGEKFPIIESQNNTGSGSATTSTRLDYYENIGIQLNVIPQVCADEYVNMIVHPAVSEIKDFEAGLVSTAAGAQSGTRYPVLKIREAETQILLKSTETAVIGGLQTERDKETIKKVPLLGDIPYLGRLFRRETLTKEKIDLLIFIKASVVNTDSYSDLSGIIEKNRQKRMELEIVADREKEKQAVIDIAPKDVIADNAAILELVNEGDSSAPVE